MFNCLFVFCFFVCVCVYITLQLMNRSLFKNLWVWPDWRKKLLKERSESYFGYKKIMIFQRSHFNVFLMTLTFYLIFLWRLIYMFGFILLSSVQYFISLERLVTKSRAFCSLWVHLVLFWFYVALNSQGHIATGSLWVEEPVHTSWSRFCTVNHWVSALPTQNPLHLSGGLYTRQN